MNRPLFVVFLLLAASLWAAAVCVCAGNSSGGISDPMASSPSASGGDPSAVFSETVHDLGKVRPDGVYEHEFRLMNTGAVDLAINKVVVG